MDQKLNPKEIDIRSIERTPSLPLDMVQKVLCQDAANLLLEKLSDLKIPTDIINLFRAVDWGNWYCFEVASRDGKVLPKDIDEDSGERFVEYINVMHRLGYRF